MAIARRLGRPALLVAAALAVSAAACGPSEPPPQTGTVINRRYTPAYVQTWTDTVCARYVTPYECYCDLTPEASYYTWGYIHGGVCVSSDYILYGSCEQRYGFQQCVQYESIPRSRNVPDRWELQVQQCNAENECRTNWIDVTREDYERTSVGANWGGTSLPPPDAGQPTPVDAAVPADGGSGT